MGNRVALFNYDYCSCQLGCSNTILVSLNEKTALDAHLRSTGDRLAYLNH